MVTVGDEHTNPRRCLSITSGRFAYASWCTNWLKCPPFNRQFKRKRQLKRKRRPYLFCWSPIKAQSGVTQRTLAVVRANPSWVSRIENDCWTTFSTVDRSSDYPETIHYYFKHVISDEQSNNRRVLLLSTISSMYVGWFSARLLHDEIRNSLIVVKKFFKSFNNNNNNNSD